jgi:hypothetical protein
MKHPTHLKITGYVGGILLLGALGSFGFGIYLQQNNQVELSHTFAISFLITTALLIAWLVFRMKLCKCPSCGKWLHKQAHEDKRKPRKFICHKCDIVWETGYDMYFKIDDPS